jgi:glycosyltransferase involved in cell wall biosynthesis
MSSAPVELVAIMPVHNEEWILDTALRTLSAVCDRIIIGDQCSTDRTAEICSRFEKVEYHLHTSEAIPEQRRNLLLDAARARPGPRTFLVIDADEILTAGALDPAFRSACTELQIGEGLELPWIILWRDPWLYRRDQTIWSDRWLPCIFRDDGAIHYEGRWHENRVPRLREFRMRRYGDAALLHYAFVLWRRSMAKHALYRIREAADQAARGEDPRRAAVGINRGYAVGKDERRMARAAIPDDWVRGWRERGVKIGTLPVDGLSWFDADVLGEFARHGTTAFADLDIWDIDWEATRLEALAQGIADVPDSPIVDPRSFEERIYHAYLKRFMATPPWRDPSVLLAPLRLLARRAGLTRERARRLGLVR